MHHINKSNFSNDQLKKCFFSFPIFIYLVYLFIWNKSMAEGGSVLYLLRLIANHCIRNQGSIYLSTGHIFWDLKEIQHLSFTLQNDFTGWKNTLITLHSSQNLEEIPLLPLHSREVHGKDTCARYDEFCAIVSHQLVYIQHTNSYTVEYCNFMFYGVSKLGFWYKSYHNWQFVDG